MFLHSFRLLEMAAGQVQTSPPRLEIEADIPAISFCLFKSTFISYIENHNISDNHALILLKTSIITGPLREVISTAGTYQEALELLSNQFKTPQDEITILKNKVTNRGVLPLNYTYDSILDNLKYILKYLTIFNRVFSPVEDFTLNEITQSLLCWMPRTQPILVIQRSRLELLRAKKERGILFSVEYQKSLMKAISKYTALSLAERLLYTQKPPVAPPSA